MSFPDKLVEYYSRELTSLKYYGIQFSKKFPGIAKRLGFIEGKSEDPHVERLIESFALLTAQLQQRLDDDLPELSEGILETLMPQFSRPIPSVTVVQFADNPSASVRQKVLVVDKHTQLYSRDTSQDGCCFRTCYPLRILPVQLTAATLVAENYENDWQLSLTLTSNALSLPADASARLYLSGDDDFNHLLYEALLSQVNSLEYRQQNRKITYSPTEIKPVGFEAENCLSVDDLNIDPIHHLIRDYAVFHERFLFIDIPLPAELFANTNPAPVSVLIKFNNSFVIKRLARQNQQCNTSNIKLNCVPVVNFFKVRAEPIIPNNNLYEYELTPDIRNKESYVIYAVNKVELKRKQEGDTETYKIEPLLGVKYKTYGHSTPHGLFWQLKRKKILLESGKIDNTFLSFSETGDFSLDRHTDIITATLTCINKQGISQITTGHPEGDFFTQMDLPGIKICGLMCPRLPVQPELDNQKQWLLISQLSLNKILYSSKEGIKILKEVLEVYNVKRKPLFSHLINLMLDMQIVAVTGKLYADDPLSIARGLSLTLIFHKTASEQAGFYLFCSILDKFMGQYAPVNSFIQTTIRIDNEDNAHSVWPKRAGNLIWL